jgi:hypothetical protein
VAGTSGRHDLAVPDNQDYAWFFSFLAQPEMWTNDDLATARDLLSYQKRAVAEAHPKDRKSRESLQEVVDALEAAIARHLASWPRP